MFIQYTQICVVGGERRRQKIYRNDLIIPNTIHQYLKNIPFPRALNHNPRFRVYVFIS